MVFLPRCRAEERLRQQRCCAQVAGIPGIWVYRSLPGSQSTDAECSSRGRVAAERIVSRPELAEHGCCLLRGR